MASRRRHRDPGADAETAAGAAADAEVASEQRDPLAHPDDAMHEYGIALTNFDTLKPADAVILAVAHDEYVRGGWPLMERLHAEGRGLVLDVKMKLDRTTAPSAIELWRL